MAVAWDVFDMDTDSLKINGEIYGRRAWANARFAVSLLGMGLLLLGAFNLLIAPVAEMAAIAPYRGTFGLISGAEADSVFYLGDVVAMAVGAIVVWLS